ncbi:Allergen Asp f 7 [Penicillium subrubescens]|uniref:Allergen Asp f 7 n=1 Tax=Penicillium subrubescens TaxID=1316194 RepID=A0A1Q5UKC0_9EURO|nr:Allergen Asp f 7 [Penicillium subrubescens]KAJ5873676.1 Allergen Asp f 7 [Penicillium subrubescens]OKP12893.1 Allergen Asp f 7 [Penicillium subrubescens]
MSILMSNFVLGLFSTSGLAGDVNDCFDAWKAISMTISPSETTPARSGLVLQEENAILSTSIAALSSLHTSYVNVVVPSSVSQSSSFNTGACSETAPCTGDITYYDTATTASNPSFCGTTNNGLTEFVVALPHGIITNSDCGKTVTVTYKGITKTGQVVDKCVGCDNTSVDLSRAFFEALAGSLDAGRISGVKWYIN